MIRMLISIGRCVATHFHIKSGLWTTLTVPKMFRPSWMQSSDAKKCSLVLVTGEGDGRTTADII